MSRNATSMLDRVSKGALDALMGTGNLADALADLRALFLADDETARTSSRPTSFVTPTGDVKQLPAQRLQDPTAHEPLRDLFEQRCGDVVEALLGAAGSSQLVLEDRVDALFTVCYVTSASRSSHLRLLQLCTCACASIEVALGLERGDESQEMVLWMAFSSLFCLLGCTCPAHWDGRPSAAAATEETSAAAACLCSAGSSSSHVPRLVVASLMENGLWATLWRDFIAPAADLSCRIGQYEAHVANLSLKLLGTLSLAFSGCALAQHSKDEADLHQHAQIVSVAQGASSADKYDDCLRTLMQLVPRTPLSLHAASAAQALLLHWKHAMKRSVSFRDVPLRSLTSWADVFQSFVENLIGAVARRHDQTAAEAKASGLEKPPALLCGTVHTSLLCALVHCADEQGPADLNVWAVASSKCPCTLQSLLTSPIFSALLSAGVLRLHQTLMAILQRSDALPSAIDIRSADVVATSVLVTPNVLYGDYKETMNKASALRIGATAVADEHASPSRRRRSFFSVLAATAESGQVVEVLTLQRVSQQSCGVHDERARLMTFSFDSGTSGHDGQLVPTLQLSDQVQDVATVLVGVPLEPAPITAERLCLRAEAQLSIFAPPLHGGPAIVSAAATRASDIELWAQQSHSVAGDPPRNAFDRRRAAAQRTRASPPPVPPRLQGFVKFHGLSALRPSAPHGDLSSASVLLNAGDGQSPPPRDPSEGTATTATPAPQTQSGRMSPRSTSESRLEDLIAAHRASLALKDAEIAFLREQVSQLEASRSSDVQRVATIEKQRDELLEATTDLRNEVALCHDEVIAPLRAEVSRLRQHLSERERQLGEALRAGRKLELENTELYSMLSEAHATMEEMSAAAQSGVLS